MIRTLIGGLAALTIVAYVALSFMTAIRMFFVRGRYVHLEFSPNRVKSGSWSERRFRLLTRLRTAALLGVAVLVVIAVVTLAA